MADRCHGYVGADLLALTQNAALNALNNNNNVGALTQNAALGALNNNNNSVGALKQNLILASLNVEAPCQEGTTTTTTTTIAASATATTPMFETRKLTFETLKAAMGEIQPSAMKEVAIQVPNVRWEDIGGMKAERTRYLISIDRWENVGGMEAAKLGCLTKND